MISDVLIIGGGVIGLSIARELHKRGARRITIADRGALGREASYAAAGMLAPNAECDRIDEFHEFCTASAKLYPRLASELLAETGINIELDRTGTLYLAFTDEDVAALNDRYEWTCSAGLEISKLSADETRSLEPLISEQVREGLLFPNDWQVENRRLVAALRRYAEIAGVSIREHTEVKDLIIDAGRIVGAKTNVGQIFAETTVIATGAWTSLIKIGGMPTNLNIKPIRGQMLSYQADPGSMRHVAYTRRGYLVPRADGRILAGATVEDVGFEKDTTAEGTAALRSIAGEIAPNVAKTGITEKWAGLRPFAPDALPVIGRIAGYEGLMFATAHYRNGILLAPATARIMATAVLDNSFEFNKAFSPNRFYAAGSAAR